MYNQRIPRARRLPNVFNKDQVMTLFTAIDNPTVMMASIIGVFCGLRIGEVCNLKKSDIDLTKMLLRVVNGKLPGKTIAGYGKDRTVPIPPKMAPLLQMWMDLKTSDLLFESIQIPNKPITSIHMFRKYKSALMKANLWFIERKNSAGKSMSRYNFHTLRHTYATMIWEKTGDIYAVKQALGHNKLETTMIYTHISDKALQNKVNSVFDIRSTANNQPQENFKSKFIDNSKPNLFENPVEVLKMRLARGELDIENFTKLKKELIDIRETNYFG